jgi:hypothetical protein
MMAIMDILLVCLPTRKGERKRIAQQRGGQALHLR